MYSMVLFPVPVSLAAAAEPSGSFHMKATDTGAPRKSACCIPRSGFLPHRNSCDRCLGMPFFSFVNIANFLPELRANSLRAVEKAGMWERVQREKVVPLFKQQGKNAPGVYCARGDVTEWRAGSSCLRRSLLEKKRSRGDAERTCGAIQSGIYTHSIPVSSRGAARWQLRLPVCWKRAPPPTHSRRNEAFGKS